jgi:methylenetetrahydrofolate reductase (NADPH)
MDVDERLPTTEPAVPLTAAQVVADSQFELVPLHGALEAASVLPPTTWVTVTCSATRGVEPTIELTERLAAAGFTAMPHVAAHSVRDRVHLEEIVVRLKEARVNQILVVGGDAKEPGDFRDGLSLLRAMDEIGHHFEEIEVPCYPEGHPLISDDMLVRALLDKQRYATSMAAQLCFHPEAFRTWLPAIRARGVTLPIILGIPGPVRMTKLARIAGRIGVAGTARYLQKQHGLLRAVLGRRAFRPDRLMPGFEEKIADPRSNVYGLHIFTFNEVDASLRWQRRTMERLGP